MFAKIDDISIHWEEDGVVKVKEIEKIVLSKGAWTTIIFLYQDFVPSEEKYSAPKVTIRRYRKIRDTYQQQSKFNISSLGQGKKIAEILQVWLKQHGDTMPGE
jgi:hypothetical protein